MATAKAAVLNIALGKAIDAAFAQRPELQPFAQAKNSGPELRNYLSETSWAQCRVFFYRDKRWTVDGGTLYAECYYLVNEIQMLLAGQPQSLAHLRPEIPAHHYQYGLDDDGEPGGERERQWEIHGLDDVARFASRLSPWLLEVVLPWTAQFGSIEAIVERLRRRGQRFPLAELLARLGRGQEADAVMFEMLEHGRARFTRQQLLRLRGAGLLHPEDVDVLAPAGDLRGEARLAIVKRWSATRKPTEI